ncbi:hypothetical protein TL16_g01958 [Triparma laevis f. inornata]|uniref:BspA family leucine-rich repeat surface protein n=1 Tax=Triparma laevis f. inornata TaxID=1714386 RepID=A0A9W6ZNV1_9STRA|nr:hypothetical protein TL16_g01958 [Triparma laevis f. inornata]
MQPRAQKKRKGNEEEGANDAAIQSEEVKVEALLAVKREQNDNPQENNVEENQAEESAMSMLLKKVRSMREEMKAGKEEMVNRSKETGQKMESVFEELIIVKGELAALKQTTDGKLKAAEREGLEKAARLWCKDRNKVIVKYGHISGWNVSSITSMSSLFGLTDVERDQGNHWNKDFNKDLSGWDTSKVTDMTAMLNCAETFSGYLSRWSVGNCKDMCAMSQDAKSFKSKLNEWNVEKVTNMSAMFAGAGSSNNDLSSWSTGNCTKMYAMFSQASTFKRDTIKN